MQDSSDVEIVRFHNSLVVVHTTPLPFVVPCLAYGDVIRYTRFVLCFPRWGPSPRMSGMHGSLLSRPGICGKRKTRNEFYLQELSSVWRDGTGTGRRRRDMRDTDGPLLLPSRR